MTKIELDDLATARLMARSSLHFYTRYMFMRRKNYRWKDNFHHRIICDALEDVFYGRTKRLIINLPPRYSKTEIAVLNFISWSLGRAPDSEFIHVSYSSTLAENNSANTQQIMCHEGYREVFPDVRLANAARAHWKTTAGGVMYAAGSGGSVTGFGAGRMREGFGGAIILDDALKAGEAGSDTVRNGVIEWYQNTLASRTNNPNTPIIVIMQRLHEQDLAGWLLGGGNGEVWEHLCIPAVNEHDEALWPWKHDRETLRQMELSSPYVFAGQYMQSPAPLGGGILKSNWFHRFDPSHPPTFKRTVQAYDTAFSTKSTADSSVCLTFGETDSAWYLLDIWCERVEFFELKQAFARNAAKWRPNAILIEEKASGQSLLQEVRRETRLPVIGIRPTQDKIARVNLITPLIESGRVFVPDGHPMTNLFLHECGQFPNGKHDDQVDALSMALTWLNSGQDMFKIRLGGV